MPVLTSPLFYLSLLVFLSQVSKLQNTLGIADKMVIRTLVGKQCLWDEILLVTDLSVQN